MHTLTTFDGYPNCILPAIKVSKNYYFFFLTYMILCLLIFVPIPVAYVFESFRKNRHNYVLQDRIK